MGNSVLASKSSSNAMVTLPVLAGVEEHVGGWHIFEVSWMSYQGAFGSNEAWAFGMTTSFEHGERLYTSVK